MKSMVAVLVLCSFSVFAEPLEFIAALTRQDASMDWWYAIPQGFTPRLTPVSEVPTGEYFRIVPFFQSYSLDTNSEAKITFDIEVKSESGKVIEAVQHCIAHDGPAKKPNLILSAAIANFCFDSDSELGTYSINITAYDHVSHTTNTQSQPIKHIPFKTETLTEEEREKLFFEYPLAPNPTRACSAFLQTEQSFFNEENEPIWSAIWFYKTIVEHNEYLIPHLIEAFPAAGEKHQKDIIMLLEMLGKADGLPKLSGDLKIFKRVMEAGRYPDPYDVIENPKQLDMLWAEFFATGKLEPIQHLVTSLEWVEHVGTLEKIKAGELNPDELEVYRAGMLEAVFQAALWSLRSNCARTPLVFQYCVGIYQRNVLEEPAQRTLGLLLQSLIDEQKKEENSETDH